MLAKQIVGDAAVHSNTGRDVSPDVASARHYLEHLAAIADYALTAENPREIFGALRIFAKPSPYLQRLAASSDE